MNMKIIILCTLFFTVVYGVPTLEIFRCKSGQEFIENECNQCFCLNNSELVCQIGKCPQNKHKGLESCRTGTAWYKGCKKCWCVNVGTVCTTNCFSN